MLGKMLAAAGLALAIAIGAYFFIQESNDGDSALANNATVLRSHIPADSIMFVTHEKGFPVDLLVNVDPSIERLAQMANSAQLQEESKLLAFWADLGVRYIRASQSGVANLRDEWGFGETVAGAAYFVGLSPVFELSLADPAKLREQVKAAAAASGLAMTSGADGAATLHRMTFTEEDGVEFTLLMRETDGWMRFALAFPAGDADAALVAGSVLPAESLATSKILNRLHDQLNVRGDMLGVLNFVALASVITDSQSVAGNMLSQLAPDLDLSTWQTPACQSELTAIANAVPEWLTATEFDYAGKAQPRTLESHTESIISIKNEWLASSLAKLNGVLPQFSDVDDFDPMYSFGLGLDVSQLTPVLMELHQGVMHQTFECEYLQSAQTSMREANPAMLGVAAAMVSGIRGASMTVNDLKLSNNPQEVASVSAIISLSAVSVRQLLALVQGFVPELAQLQIPEDGSAVPLRSAMLPPQVPPLQIAIKDDQHVVIMTEDALSQHLASTFNGLGIEGNGLISVTLNAGKLAEVSSAMSDHDLLGTAALPKEICAEIAIMEAAYRNTELKMSGEMRFAAEGFKANGTASQTLPSAEAFRVPAGTYDTYYVGDGCELRREGSATLLADAQGTMTQLSTEPNCDAASYESTFQWRQRGLGMHYTFQQKRERENCNTQWSQWSEVTEANQNKSCVVTTVDESGFRCVFTDENNETYNYVYKHRSE